MSHKFLIISFLCILHCSIHAQNNPTFFKETPKITAETPQWAVDMYGENPNVWEVQSAYEAYFKQHTFTKTIHTQNYRYWSRMTSPYVTDQGFIRYNRSEEARKLARFKDQRQLDKANRNPIWTNIGPNRTYKSDGSLNLRPTQTNVYCLAAAPSDSTILYCGTEGGGFFKSTDHGLNWTLTTANESFTAGADIKIHSTNPDIVYIATNSDIYKTLDGGTTWTLNYTAAGRVEQMFIHPTQPNKVFAATADGLYYTDNDGTSWTNIRAGRHWDIEANPQNPNTLYLATKNTTALRAEIFKSLDGGNNWTLMDNGWYTPTDMSQAEDNGCKIGVTPADTNRVYTCLLGNSKAGDQNWIGVYYSLDGGANWVDADGQDGGPYASGNDMNTIWYANGYSSGYNQGWYNFDLDVSHSNPDRIWIGTIWDLESNNRGANLEYFRGTRSLEMHADVQDIDVVGGDVWIASDGGINYSNDEFQSTEIRNTGISASNFWGFSQGWNEDTWTGGRYHNGDAVYHENFGIGNTMFMGGAEAATGYINQFENRKSYYSDISSKILPDALNESASSFSSLALYPNATYTQLNSSEIEHDPRYGDHLYLGRDSVFYKSTNTGVSFNALYTFPDGSRVLEFEISRTNPNLIYCLVRRNNVGTIYKSLDGGNSFSPITNIPSNSLSWLDLSLNQANPNQLWVMTRYGSNGNKVYETTDGGQSWTNRTTSTLDGHNFIDIVYQTGSNDIVYLLSQYAVFHWDAAQNDWVLYSDGLPFVISEAREIIPFYRDSKLRLSCARGIWEAPFAGDFDPLAQPMTHTDQVYCSRDTVQVDCYSFLDHAGATWSWSFNPAPTYIDDPSVRNPRVVFDQNGSYSAMLTITDGSGESSSRIVNDFIVLDNLCDPDTIPGLAMQCSNSGDYANIPDLNLSTNTFTISAWIKADSIQPEYSGIVMNDNSAAGLNFKDNNQLAYHWPGGAWWWNSGLFAPTDEWAHVALVATPTSITIYLNGVGATHNTSIDVVDIRTMKIGSYQGWGSRNYKGEIDEVALWNRALSQEEIREIRHLTHPTTSTASTGLLAYYQFNTSGTTEVLDKIATNAAAMAGTAIKTVSSAPVAGGSSHRLTVNAAGNYSFGDTETEIFFGNQHPDGEIVVSRLHVLPNELPSSNPNTGNYWVINNYGNNTTFDPIISMNVKPYPNADLTSQVSNDPSIARLYKRTSNEHNNNWVDQCGASIAQNGTFTFDNSCSLTSFSQFTIVSSTPITSLLPIEWLSFTALAEDNERVLLSWQTLTEINNDFFTVERSKDGTNWESIGKVNAGNANSQVQTYQLSDEQPLHGRAYYRIKQTDLNGESSYSSVESVFIHPPHTLTVYPNPASKQITLLTYSSTPKGRFTIYNVKGKVKKDIFITENEQQIDISSLSAGIYFYTFQGETFLQNGRLIVK